MSTELLQFAIEHRDRDTIVTISGSADMDQLDRLGPQLMDAARSADRKLILRMSDLTFICSAGLGLLIQAHNICHKRGVAIALAGLTDPVRRILQATRLTKLLPEFGTLDEAIAAAEPDRR